MTIENKIDDDDLENFTKVIMFHKLGKDKYKNLAKVKEEEVKFLKRKLDNFNNSLFLILYGIIKFISNVFKFSISSRNVLIKLACENNMVDNEVYNKVRIDKNYLFSHTNLSKSCKCATLIITIIWTLCLLIANKNIGNYIQSFLYFMSGFIGYLLNLFCLYSSMLIFDYFLAVK